MRVTHTYGADPFAELIPMLPEIDGVFLADDVYAVEVCRRLAEAGRAPGEGMPVVAQADCSFAPGLPPDIDRIEFDLSGLGAMAVQLLERMLDSGESIFPPIRIAGKFVPAMTVGMQKKGKVS